MKKETEREEQLRCIGANLALDFACSKRPILTIERIMKKFNRLYSPKMNEEYNFTDSEIVSATLEEYKQDIQ